MKVANWNARENVQQLIPFKGNNTFAMNVGNAYVVYSYGEHWPMFAHINGQWYENGDRYSVTTSKHRTQLHPHTDTKIVSVDEIRDMVRLEHRSSFFAA